MDSVYDRALLEVGDNGYFQKKFDVVYNCALPFFWIMAYLNIVLVLAVIPHTCKVPNKPENISELAWKTKFIPRSADIKGQLKFDDCLIYANPEVNNNTEHCNEFEYDRIWYESTVPSDNDWVCDDELYVANVFAYSRAGEIAGSLFFGWFGDMYGRRLTYIFSMALVVLGRIISIFGSHIFILFVSGCIITCLSSWLVVQSTLVISMEVSSADRRAGIATLRNASSSCGMCIMPLLYWWLRDWKLLMIVTTASQMLFLVFSWHILESPRWLWIAGKPDECIKQLKRIAAVNKTKLSAETAKDIKIMPSGGQIQSLGIFALFSSYALAMNTILQLAIASCVTITYTTLLMSSSEKSDSNPFLEIIWQTIAELPGFFMGAWLAQNIGRRRTMAGSFIMSTLIWIVVTCREYSTNGWIRQYWIVLEFVCMQH